MLLVFINSKITTMNTEKLEQMSLEDFKGLETLRVYFESSLEYVMEEAEKITPTPSLEEEAKENAIGMFLDNLNDMGQHDCMETLFDLINEL